MSKRIIKRTVILTFLVFGTKTSLFAQKIELDRFQAVALQYEERGLKRIHSLKKLLKEAQVFSEQDRLAQVNAFFNQVPYSNDQKCWGDSDYWATPIEFLTKGEGDCEDYAIAKFFTLLELGIPQEKLFLTYVVTNNLSQRHMVLAYYEYEGAVPLILDNRVFTIDSEKMDKNYIPLYRFNLNDFIAFDQGIEQKRPVELKKLYKWEDLTKRLSKAMS